MFCQLTLGNSSVPYCWIYIQPSNISHHTAIHGFFLQQINVLILSVQLTGDRAVDEQAEEEKRREEAEEEKGRLSRPDGVPVPPREGQLQL